MENLCLTKISPRAVTPGCPGSALPKGAPAEVGRWRWTSCPMDPPQKGTLANSLKDLCIADSNLTSHTWTGLSSQINQRSVSSMMKQTQKDTILAVKYSPTDKPSSWYLMVYRGVGKKTRLFSKTNRFCSNLNHCCHPGDVRAETKHLISWRTSFPASSLQLSDLGSSARKQNMGTK